MTLRKFPDLPPLSDVPVGLQGYLGELHKFFSDVYLKLKFQDLKNITFTTTDAAPIGGKDGDIHVRVDGANTALYININGSWSAYTNP